MAETIARPSAAVPESVGPDATVAKADAVAKPAAAASKTKHAHNDSASAPRKVRFNVGSNYKVLEIIGEGVRALLLMDAAEVDHSRRRRLVA